MVLRVSLSACLVLLFSSSAPCQDAAIELFNKMQQALGGADKIAAIHDYEEIVTAQAWNNTGKLMGTVRKRTRWIKPNLLRLDQTGPGDTYVLYFDGTSGWEILPDRRNPDQTTGVSIDLVGGELEFAKGYLSGFFVNFWLADRMPGYAITSPAPNVVRISHEGKATDITLDPKTWLPIKQASISLADPSKPVAAEMRISEWSVVDGVYFATKRANYHDGVKLAEITTEEVVRINAGLKQEDLTAKPADFNPVMGGR